MALTTHSIVVHASTGVAKVTVNVHNANGTLSNTVTTYNGGSAYRESHTSNWYIIIYPVCQDGYSNPNYSAGTKIYFGQDLEIWVTAQSSGGGGGGGGGGETVTYHTVGFTTGTGLLRVNYKVTRDTNIIASGTLASGLSRSYTYPAVDSYGSKYQIKLWVESTDYASGYGPPVYNVGTYSFSSDIEKTIYATKLPETYTVTFNSNTSDGVSNMPSNITNAYGTKEIPSNIPRRTGYTFDYWYNRYDVRYLPNANIDVYENITLYAHWTQTWFYLYFNANTSDHVSQMPDTVPRAGGGDVTIPSDTPLRDFYRFTGWNTKADGTGTPYQPSEIYNLTTDTTLYAQWQRTYTYTITYKSNEGIFSTYAGRPEQTSYPDTHTGTSSSFLIKILYSNDLKPARNGYTFSGWNDTASGTGQTFIGGNSYSFSGNYTLYAQWAARSYTITINPNGGYIGGSASSINVSKNYGETFSFSPYLPTRQYYDFEGWLSSGGVNKGGNDSYVVSGNETWTAQWSDIHSYKLTLYANYSGAPHVSSEITRTGGTQISLSEYSDNFVRGGYKLMGWSHDPNATAGSADYAVDGVVTLSTNITLYAIWLKTYTVSYYSQGRLFATDYGDFIATTDNQGSGSGYLPNAYADVISLIPTWADHNFKGWANSSSATVPDYTSGQSHAIPVTGNVTLYAVWQWQTLDPFYWTGTYSGDLALFQTGLPVSDAITAAGWNNLIAKIDALIQRAGLSVSTAKPSYATSGMSIMASLYNAMRGYIVAVLLQMNIGTAYFPPTVSTGDVITPYHFAFEGTNSLQGAVNHAISVFNNSLN